MNLTNIPTKIEFKETTSHRFKEDVQTFFNDPYFKDKIALEIGASVGYSTLVLSELFGKVISVEWKETSFQQLQTRTKNKPNVECVQMDVYNDPWPWSGVTVTFIDCMHLYFHVLKDIQNALNCGSEYLVFDDYGLLPDVKQAVQHAIKYMPLKFVRYIGEPKEAQFHPTKKATDWEGIILQKTTTLL